MVHPIHFSVEILLGIFIVYLFFQKSYKPHKHSESLTQQEEEQLIDEWKPAPLVPTVDPRMMNQDPSAVISSPPDSHLLLSGKKVINLATTNFHGLSNHPEVKETARKAIEKYGVGTCGPRGFYGTLESHLDTEKRIAQFMGTEECILYSAGFATASSAIPAFSSRGDLILCDSGVRFALNLGVVLSRTDLKFFKHNDMAELEKMLEQIRQDDLKTKRKLNRRFVVVEGLYFNHGDLVPLKKLMELKEKYKFRIIMDDSCGIGILGKTGRGTCEHFGFPPSSIEILCSNMDYALGSVGGFCVGSYQVVYHQRLNSSGYVFSASSPPYLVEGACKAVDMIDKDPTLISGLAAKVSYGRSRLDSELGKQGLVDVVGDVVSPIIHLRLKKQFKDRLEAETLLQSVARKALEHGVAVSAPLYGLFEKTTPTIRICINSMLSEKELDVAVDALKASLSSVLEGH